MYFKTKLARFFTFIVAIQLLNASIYNTQFESVNTGNFLVDNVHNTNSFIEYILENLLQLKKVQTNKPDKHHQKESHSHKNFQVNLFTTNSTIYCLNVVSYSQKIQISSTKNYYYLFSKEIIPPPPKA